MKYSCVFSDLDHTLLNSEGKLSEFTKETIELLTARGIDFIFSTGRAFYSLPKDVFNIKGACYAITSNGVSVNRLEDGSSVLSRCIDSRDIEELMSFLKDKKVLLECFVKGQGYTCQAYWDNPVCFGGSTYKIEYIQSTRIPVSDINSFILENKNSIEALDIISPAEKRDVLLEEIEKKFPLLYCTFSEAFLIEISHKDSGKHKGMEYLCSLLGKDLTQAIAFGDGDNDIEMIKSAGLGIAVSNASTNCKNAADKIIGSNNEDAVAKELRKIFLI